MVALSSWGDNESRPLFQNAAKSTIPRVEQAAIIALDRLEASLERLCPTDKQTAKNLVEFLKHPSQRIRDEAALALKRFGKEAAWAAPEVVAAFIRHDGTGAPKVVAGYLEVLRGFGIASTSVRNALVEALSERLPLYSNREEADAHALRSYILVTLVDIGGATPGAMPHILDYLNNGELDMQYAFAASARAVATHDSSGKEAVPLLQRALDLEYNDKAIHFDYFQSNTIPSGKQTSARLEAIKALERIGRAAKSALPLLERLAELQGEPKSDLPSCKEAALKAIASIER
jgi:HEAT repeat protein